jgi:hypothetical protein
MEKPSYLPHQRQKPRKISKPAAELAHVTSSILNPRRKRALLETSGGFKLQARQPVKARI